MICKHILWITFSNESNLSLLHTVQWFQELLSMTNNSIKHQSFVFQQLNDQIILFLKIQFTISHLFAHSLSGQTVLFDP